MLMAHILINTRLAKFVPKTDKVKEIFKDIFVPTAEDWQALKEAVQKMAYTTKIG